MHCVLYSATLLHLNTSLESDAHNLTRNPIKYFLCDFFKGTSLSGIFWVFHGNSFVGKLMGQASWLVKVTHTNTINIDSIISSVKVKISLVVSWHPDQIQPTKNKIALNALTHTGWLFGMESLCIQWGLLPEKCAVCPGCQPYLHQWLEGRVY